MTEPMTVPVAVPDPEMSTTIEVDVTRGVDDAHAAAADLPDDAVLAEPLAVEGAGEPGGVGVVGSGGGLANHGIRCNKAGDVIDMAIGMVTR